jgi:amicyanin
MRPLALVALYALVAALVLPSSILAQDDVAHEEQPAPAQAPAEPAPAPAEPAPEPPPLRDETAELPNTKPKAIAAASGSVTIADFNFAPATITVDVGDTVTWNNNGPTPHSATAKDGSFDTGILRKGQSGSHTFDQAGTYSYICTPHPFMKGTVVVQAAQSGGGDTSGSGSAATGDTGSTGGSGAEAAQSDNSPTLPNSGSDSGALLLLGALLLMAGIAVHRHTTTG